MRKIVVLLALLLCVYVAKAQQKISQMATVTTVSATDYIPIIQSSVNKKVTAMVLSTYINSEIDTTLIATQYDVSYVQQQVNDTVTLFATQYDVSYVQQQVNDTINATGILVMVKDSVSTSQYNYMTFENYYNEAEASSLLKIQKLNGSGDIAYPVGMIAGYSALALTDGYGLYSLIYIERKVTCSGIRYHMQVQGNFTGDNYNGFVMYKASSDSIRLVAATDNNEGFLEATAGSSYTASFVTPYVAEPGFYYIGVIYNSSAQVVAPSITIGTTPGVIYNTGGIYRWIGSRTQSTAEPAFVRVNGLSVINSGPALILR